MRYTSGVFQTLNLTEETQTKKRASRIPTAQASVQPLPYAPANAEIIKPKLARGGGGVSGGNICKYNLLL